MPCSANILFLVRFFTHLGNNRMRIDWLEKSVNVYLTPALGKFNVLVGCYILTTKKYYAVITKGLSYFGKLLVTNTGSDINATDFGTQFTTYWCCNYGFIC